MQGGLVTTKLSFRPSVYLSVCLLNASFVTKRNKFVATFLYHNVMSWKTNYASFEKRRMVGGGDPFLLKFFVKLTPLERKRRFSVDIRS